MILHANRALRRFHRERMIARARKSLVFMDMDEADRLAWALRQHDHLKSCSCWMCGNPRKWYGEQTIQERRQGAGGERRIIGGQDGEF